MRAATAASTNSRRWRRISGTNQPSPKGWSSSDRRCRRLRRIVSPSQSSASAARDRLSRVGGRRTGSTTSTSRPFSVWRQPASTVTEPSRRTARAGNAPPSCGSSCVESLRRSARNPSLAATATSWAGEGSASAKPWAWARASWDRGRPWWRPTMARARSPERADFGSASTTSPAWLFLEALPIDLEGAGRTGQGIGHPDDRAGPVDPDAEHHHAVAVGQPHQQGKAPERGHGLEIKRRRPGRKSGRVRDGEKGRHVGFGVAQTETIGRLGRVERQAVGVGHGLEAGQGCLHGWLRRHGARAGRACPRRGRKRFEGQKSVQYEIVVTRVKLCGDSAYP